MDIFRGIMKQMFDKFVCNIFFGEVTDFIEGVIMNVEENESICIFRKFIKCVVNFVAIQF